MHLEELASLEAKAPPKWMGVDESIPERRLLGAKAEKRVFYWEYNEGSSLTERR